MGQASPAQPTARRERAEDGVPGHEPRDRAHGGHYGRGLGVGQRERRADRARACQDCDVTRGSPPRRPPGREGGTCTHRRRALPGGHRERRTVRVWAGRRRAVVGRREERASARAAVPG